MILVLKKISGRYQIKCCIKIHLIFTDFLDFCCEYKKVISAPKDEFPKYLPYCPPDEELYYANPFSCREYLYCYYGQLYPQKCFYGFRFSREYLRCSFFLFVNCENKATNPLNPAGRPTLPGVLTIDYNTNSTEIY